MAFQDFGLLQYLPVYISLTLFLSYLVWSKFIGEKNFYPKDIEGILEILGLFFIILPSIFLFLFILFEIINITNMFTITTNQMITLLKEVITKYILPILIFVFVVFFANKETEKKDLDKFLITIYESYWIFAIIIIGLVTYLFFTPYRYLSGDLFIWVLILLFIIGLYRLMINKVFKLEEMPKIYRYLFFVFILMIVYCFFSVPSITQESDIKGLTYNIHDPYSRKNYEHAYLLIESHKEIKNFKWNPLVTQIPLSYPLNLETRNLGNANFEILINTSKEKNFQQVVYKFKTLEEKPFNQKYGFVDSSVDEREKRIILKFDKNTIKKENIKQIILKGYIKTNITKTNYSYKDNSYNDQLCNGNKCFLKINIENNLDLPVKQYEHTIFNLNQEITNTTNCGFNGFNLEYDTSNKENIKIIGSGCKGNMCLIELVNMENKKNIFTMQLVKDGTNIKSHFIDIEQPIKLDATVHIFC